MIDLSGVELSAGDEDAVRDHDHALAEPRPLVLDPVVTVAGATAVEQVWVADALARFEAAGMPLPDVEIVFHDSKDGCKGQEGLFQAQFTPWRVLVCSELEFVVTHELAHAWEAATLTDAERGSYVDFRGMVTWSDSDVDWCDRAVEDAAFVVQQNLMAGKVNVESPSWAERTAAFEALTGRVSPLIDSA